MAAKLLKLQSARIVAAMGFVVVELKATVRFRLVTMFPGPRVGSNRRLGLRCGSLKGVPTVVLGLWSAPTSPNLIPLGATRSGELLLPSIWVCRPTAPLVVLAGLLVLGTYLWRLGTLILSPTGPGLVASA